MDKTIEILEYLSTLECTARVHEAYSNGYTHYAYDYEQSMPSLMETILNSDVKERMKATYNKRFNTYQIVITYNAHQTIYYITPNASLYSNS